LSSFVVVQEAVVLAKWLKSVTLAVASGDPTNEHAAFLGAFNSEFTLGWV
jgi:hypothetical protein